MSLENHLRFAKIKSSKLVVTFNNLLVDLFIHQTYFTKIFIQFHQTLSIPNFPLYGTFSSHTQAIHIYYVTVQGDIGIESSILHAVISVA